MAKQNRNFHIPQAQSYSEGVGSGLKRSVEMLPNGQTVMSLSLDFTTAPVPDRKYVADVAWVVQATDSIKLLFGQNKVSSGLRSLLVINISPESAKVFINAIDLVQKPSFREIAELTQLAIPQLIEITEEPEQTIAFKANIISGSVSGHDACIDFYYISPISMRNLATMDKAGIDAVVRVDIQVNLFVAFIEQLKVVSQNYPSIKEYSNEQL